MLRIYRETLLQNLVICSDCFIDCYIHVRTVMNSIKHLLSFDIVCFFSQNTELTKNSYKFILCPKEAFFNLQKYEP